MTRRYSPIVPAARWGKGLARQRRFANIGTSYPMKISDGNFYDVPLLGQTDNGPGGTGYPDPTEVGESSLWGVNTTLGGALTVSWASDIQLAGTWQADLTFTGVGAWAMLLGIEYSDQLRWVVLASNGVT